MEMLSRKGDTKRQARECIYISIYIYKRIPIGPHTVCCLGGTQHHGEGKQTTYISAEKVVLEPLEGMSLEARDCVEEDNIVPCVG